MSKHTPGPWAFVAADDISSEHRYISSHWVSGPFTDESQYRTICDIAKWDTQERQIANAQLISAAPDLLEALKELEKNFFFDPKKDKAGYANEMRQKLIDVINKATGE